MKGWCCGLFLALLCAAPARAEEAERIGRIRTVDGAASIDRNGTTVPAAIGEDVHRGDVIRTGKRGSVGIVLNDETSHEVARAFADETDPVQHEEAPTAGSVG